MRGPSQIIISTLSDRHSAGLDIVCGATNTATETVAHTANRAYYLPIFLDRSIIAMKLWVANFATINGNIDLGLYNCSSSFVPSTKIISSGSTAHANANDLQEVDITDTYLAGPGIYFLGIASDSSTATFSRVDVNNLFPRVVGAMQQASAFPLPSTATPVAYAVSSYYLAGLSCRTLVA